MNRTPSHMQRSIFNDFRASRKKQALFFLPKNIFKRKEIYEAIVRHEEEASHMEKRITEEMVIKKQTSCFLLVRGLLFRLLSYFIIH